MGCADSRYLWVTNRSIQVGNVPWTPELSTGWCQGLLSGHLTALSIDFIVPCASFSSCNMEKHLKPQQGSSPHL